MDSSLNLESNDDSYESHMLGAYFALQRTLEIFKGKVEKSNYPCALQKKLLTPWVCWMHSQIQNIKFFSS